MSRERAARRELWRKVEKVSRRGGDVPIGDMEEHFLPCRNCGGARRHTPPVMARVLLEHHNMPVVESPTHCGSVKVTSANGMEPVICESCHEVAFVTEPEYFDGGLVDDDLEA